MAENQLIMPALIEIYIQIIAIMDLFSEEKSIIFSETHWNNLLLVFVKFIAHYADGAKFMLADT